MGIEKAIDVGGHFPEKDDPTAAPLAWLDGAPEITAKHPSFNLRDAQGKQPALDELRALVEAGYGRLYKDRKEAERALGGDCFPAPLGNVTKLGPDGVTKHRLIQDLRRNLVNDCAGVPERQVLPRFLDHALDLAEASAATDADGVDTLILDFRRAFMSIPVSRAELRYNCCLSTEPLRRARGPLDATEPEEGTFIVWNVLGFGGRTYPLLYARVPLVTPLSRSPRIV